MQELPVSLDAAKCQYFTWSDCLSDLQPSDWINNDIAEILQIKVLQTNSMFNIINKFNVAAKLDTPRQGKLLPELKEEEIKQNHEQSTMCNGLPICPVSGDASKACNMTACLSKDKVRHPYYLIDVPKPACPVARELTEQLQSDLVHDKVRHQEKPLPRCPQTLPPLPARRDPYEEQQRRALLAEYRQRLTKYNKQ